MDGPVLAFRQIDEWVTRSWKHFIVTLIALSCAAMFCGFLGFILPQLAADSALSSALTAMTDEQNHLDTVQSTLDEQTAWFVSSYVTGLDGLVTRSRNQFVEATKSFELGKQEKSLDRKIELLGQAEDLFKGSRVDSVKSLLSLVEITIGTNNGKRDTARRLYDTTAQSVAPLGEQTAPLTKRYTDESPLYLSIYMVPLGADVQKMNDTRKNASDTLARALSLLPVDGDTSGVGDPDAATRELNLINGADGLVATTTGLITSNTKTLDYQKTATAEAQSKTDQAVTDLASVRALIDGTAISRSWSLDKALKEAQRLYLEATPILSSAQSELVINVEGDKKDLPAAYEHARAASKKASEATAEVNNQITLADTSQQLINDYDTKRSDSQGIIDSAVNKRATLVSYHATTTWSDVSNKVADAQVEMMNAANSFDSAKTAHADQRFNDAKKSIDDADTSLANAKSYAQTIIDRALTLESYRTNWPSHRDNAQQMIDNQRTNVSLYRTEDYSAANDYDTAVSWLNSANTYASERDYGQAISYADQAYSKANGTGQRLANAFSNRIAREKREEEERQAAERRRQQQLLDQASHSSGGYGGDAGGGYNNPSTYHSDPIEYDGGEY